MSGRVAAFVFAVAVAVIAWCGPKQYHISLAKVDGVAVEGKAIRFDPVATVDSRADLVRIAVRMLSRPHTAHRIDSLTLDGRKATDIDGVDFERWFQFEDDGAITIEIDFSASKTTPRQLIVYTNDGTYTLNLTKK